MKTQYCTNCKNEVGKTDGERICFTHNGFDVFVTFKKQKSFDLECSCGKLNKIFNKSLTKESK